MESLTFQRSNTGIVFTKIAVISTTYPTVEMLAMMWLYDDVEKAPPPSKSALESRIREDVRLHGKQWEERVGFHWGDHLNDPTEYDQEMVAKQLATTMARIRELYEIEE